LASSPSRGGTAFNNGDYNIIDINGNKVSEEHHLPKKRNKTAGQAHNPRFAKKKALQKRTMQGQAEAPIINQSEFAQLRHTMNVQ
jgi:hypothetical protein